MSDGLSSGAGASRESWMTNDGRSQAGSDAAPTLDDFLHSSSTAKQPGGKGKGGGDTGGIERASELPSFLQQLKTDPNTGGALVGGLWKPPQAGDSSGEGTTVALKAGEDSSRERPTLALVSLRAPRPAVHGGAHPAHLFMQQCE